MKQIEAFEAILDNKHVSDKMFRNGLKSEKGENVRKGYLQERFVVYLTAMIIKIRSFRWQFCMQRRKGIKSYILSGL